MFKLAEQIIDDLRNGKNIENYLIILLALVILILEVFNLGRPEWISNVTLSILALLAYGRISDARSLEHFVSKMPSISGTQLLQEFPPSLIEDMNNTSELWMVGITLSRTINTHYSLLKRKLEEGAAIRVLLVKPMSAATEMAAARDRRSKQQSDYDHAVESTLADFCQLARLTRGNIELRTINAALSFGYYAMKPNTEYGTLYVEHYGFKDEHGDVPKLVLKRIDGYLYNVFLNQLNTLWNNAVVWSCSEANSDVV